MPHPNHAQAETNKKAISVRSPALLASSVFLLLATRGLYYSRKYQMWPFSAESADMDQADVSVF
jgi:hypothetical protein